MEHLVGIPGRPQLVPEASCNPGLHSVDPLIVLFTKEIQIWYMYINVVHELHAFTLSI